MPSKTLCFFATRQSEGWPTEGVESTHINSDPNCPLEFRVSSDCSSKTCLQCFQLSDDASTDGSVVVVTILVH